MPVEIIYSKHIAVGQKSGSDPGAYGRGFNYQVFAKFRGDGPAGAEKILAAVLKQIDHRLLGIDAGVIGDPSTANICAWIYDELVRCGAAVSEVHLIRGDGLEARR